MKFRLGGRTICLCECLIVEVPLDGARAHATLKPRHRHQPQSQSLPLPPSLCSRLIYIVNYSCSIVCVCSGSLAWKHLSVIVSFHRRRPSSFMIYLSQFDLCTFVHIQPGFVCVRVPFAAQLQQRQRQQQKCCGYLRSVSETSCYQFKAFLGQRQRQRQNVARHSPAQIYVLLIQEPDNCTKLAPGLWSGSPVAARQTRQAHRPIRLVIAIWLLCSQLCHSHFHLRLHLPLPLPPDGHSVWLSQSRHV